MIHPTCGSPRRKTNSVASPPAREASETPHRRRKLTPGDPGGWSPPFLSNPLSEPPREVVLAKGIEAVEHIPRRAIAQVGLHEVQGGGPGGGVERADLAQDAGDRLVAGRDLGDGVDRELQP